MSRPERAVAADNEVAELVAKARKAQAVYEGFSQEQVDAIVRDIGKYVYDNAELLARMAVDETGIGNYEDKVLKKKGKARAIWNSLKGKKSRGIIGEDAENNLVFVAKPMGVVGAVAPMTNPIVTPMCNGMFALKTGNAVIFAPHPKAQKCAEHLTDAFMEIVRKHGGPEDLVQVVRNGSIDEDAGADGLGRRGRRHRRRGDGEVGLLVGQALVRRRRGQRAGDHRPRRRSRRGGRQDRHRRLVRQRHHLPPRAVRARARGTLRRDRQAFTDTGKVWFTDDESADPEAARRGVPRRPPEQGRRRHVGARDRRDGGIDVPASARLILLPAKGAGDGRHPGDARSSARSSRSCPTRHSTTRCSKAKANLLVEGAGHSAALHSNDESNIRHAGLELPISRLVVNQASSLTAGGSLTNGFAPTTTLGCGSWGGNSISENLDYKHLMNVSRIGKVIENKKVPTDEEIFAP